MVSMPSDSGITSSSSRSPAALLPASWLAWIAAPSATTSSGFRLVSGSRPKNSATARRICGMRVEPPTSTTPCTSSLASLASRRALRTAAMVRAVRSRRDCLELARASIATSAVLPPPAQLRNVTDSDDGQRFLGGTRRHLEARPCRCASRGLQARLAQHPVGQRVVVVVAAQRRVAARGDDFEHALRSGAGSRCRRCRRRGRRRRRRLRWRCPGRRRWRRRSAR